MLHASNTKKCVKGVISYVNFMKDNRVRDILLSATTLENPTTDGYMETTVKELEKINIRIFHLPVSYLASVLMVLPI